MGRMVFLCLIVPKTFERMVYMRKLYKITNIALIFMVISILVCRDIGYASNLRVPMERYNRIEEKLQDTSEEGYYDVEKDLEYNIPWPDLTIFSDTFVNKKSFTEEHIRKRLERYFYYQISSDKQKQDLISRVQDLSVVPEYVFEYFERHFPGRKIVNISIYGSVLYGDIEIPMSDVDLLVIVKGDALEYQSIPLSNDFPEIPYLSSEINEVSFLIIGEDNLIEGVRSDGFIQVRRARLYNIIQNTLCLLPFIYATLYGRDFAETDYLQKNWKVRTINLIRQVEHKLNKLTDEKTDYERNQLKQALIRIHLANLLLVHLDPDTKVDFEEIDRVKKDVVRGIAWDESVLKLYRELLERINDISTDKLDLLSPSPVEETVYECWQALVAGDKGRVNQILKDLAQSTPTLVKHRFITPEDLAEAKRRYQYSFEGPTNPEAHMASLIVHNFLSESLESKKLYDDFIFPAIVAVENVLQHVVSAPAESEALMLMFEKKFTDYSEWWIYIIDAAPSMPVGRVIDGEYRAPTGRHGTAIQSLRNDTEVINDWAIVSLEEQWSEISDTLTEPPFPTPPKGTLFTAHTIIRENVAIPLIEQFPLNNASPIDLSL